MPIPDLAAALAALGLDPDDNDHDVEVTAVTEAARRARLRAELRAAGHPATLGPTIRAPLHEPSAQTSWPPFTPPRHLSAVRPAILEDGPQAPHGGN